MRCINFYDLCRICTATADQKTNVFSPEGKRKNLSVKIAECLTLNIDEKDRLPKVICSQCLQHVDNIFEFRNICRNSQTMLNSCLNTATTQTGDKIYIKDAITGSGKSISVVGSSIPSGTGGGVKQMPTMMLQAPSMNVNTAAATSTTQTTLHGNDLINTIMAAVGIQPRDCNQQYTITLDNNGLKECKIESSLAQTTGSISAHQQELVEKNAKHNALEEFLKLKPDIKVTQIGKKDNIKVQQQPLQQQQQQMFTQTLQQAGMQETLQQQQQQQQLPPLVQPLQLQQLQQQLQQQLHQQWQQQQLQQQLQLLTTQIQQQQQQQQHITIAAPQSTATTMTTNSNEESPSPSKNKKPKLNFFLSSPATNQPIMTTTQQAQPQQIQFQFQPSTNLGNQQQHQINTAALLSSLAPQATGNLMSPNKCFLPITIRDENSDQQIVAHIDAKNFVLPTTYQVQMKLQPQLATADGQPIMQLQSTSIPATLQLTPQALTNQTFHTAGSANSLQTQFLQQSAQLVLEQRQQLRQSAQVTSQQIISTPTAMNNTSSNYNHNTSDVATSTNDQLDDFSHGLHGMKTVYRMSQPDVEAANTIAEIKPTTNFSQQIMQQVKKQQKQKQQAKQQQADTLPVTHAGVTLQRLTTGTTTTAKGAQASLPAQSVMQQTSTSKLPVLNKQNITISRVATQQQQQQQSRTQQLQQPQIPLVVSKQKTQQQQTKTKIINQKQKQQEQQQQQQQPQQQQHTKLVMPALQQQTQTLKLSPTTKRKIVRKNVAIKTDATPSTTTKTTSQKSTPNSQQQTEQPQTNTVRNVATQNNAAGTTVSAFTCPTCGRGFKKKEHLTQHVKLHAGLRPFKCTEPNCGKAFSRKEHLHRHLVSHTGKKMFSCDLCDKPFSRKDNLNKHKRIHTAQPNSTQYKCGICNKNFAVKVYYQQHKAMHARQLDAAGTAVKVDNKNQSTSETPTKPELQQSTQPQQQQHTQLQMQQTQQQLQVVQQPTPQQQQHQQQQQQQIVHLQLQPTTVVTTQDLAGNTITITQSNDPNHTHAQLKAIGSHHDNTVLNLPPVLTNYMQLGQTQFLNTTTGQIVCKIDK